MTRVKRHVLVGGLKGGGGGGGFEGALIVLCCIIPLTADCEEDECIVVLLSVSLGSFGWNRDCETDSIGNSLLNCNCILSCRDTLQGAEKICATIVSLE